MSQTHTHGPGTHPGHTHGPPPPPPPQMAMRPPDPLMQAVIEASFRPVNFALGPPENGSVLCGLHKLEKCEGCDVDYTGLNRLSRTLHSNSNLRCPPPPNMVNKQLSQAVVNTKEEGNALFKGGLYDKAIQRYTMAANIASQRPPWEHQILLREELATVLSNRAAAFLEIGDYISSLVDAEVVIQLRRNWSKGYFRKAKALLKMDRPKEAREAIQVGLAFDPDNKELQEILARIDHFLARREQGHQSNEMASPDPQSPIPPAS
ncbi:TPR-like protein [Daedalea quercina L-15889]|uniref:TPR-like protein n=1 Tax=Daedalea quercina L-15889 TaxID=1314783 RepID=A0A165RI89_9APHY|nr:TPR-like protein [Daedalea quercina L-15889]